MSLKPLPAGGPTSGLAGRQRPVNARISVVIPALNEAANLPHVFGRLPENLFEVILVDGGSTDDTVAIARRLRPDIRVMGQTRSGKGNALKAGFEACRGDIVVMIDADGSTDPAEIPRFVAPLLGGVDFAKGSRFLRGGGSADLTRSRRAGNWALSHTVNVLFGTGYSDLCYGYNAFWRDCLPVLAVDCDGFEVEALMNIRIAKAGLRILEVPSFEFRRIHGESNLNALRDGYRVLRTIVSERFRRSTVGSEVSGADVPHRVRVTGPRSTASDARGGRVISTPGAGSRTSVVVSTYDERRWADLAACLGSLERQSRPPREVLVVVDHNPGLLRKVTDAFPAVGVVANRRSRGLAGARNTGTAAARGEIVAFIDDDAQADAEWLERLEACFDDVATAGAGGALHPLWKSSPPGWFPPEFYWVVGCSYAGLPDRRVAVRNPIGANMAVRASVLKAVGGFREGGAGDAPREIRSRGMVRAAGNVPDDTDLAIRVTRRLPHAVWLYEPAARVRHSVSPERASLGYFVRRCCEEGVGKANLCAYVGSADGLRSERRHVVATLPRGVARDLRSAVRGDRSGVLRAAATVLGTVVTGTAFAVSRGRWATHSWWTS